jgi:Sec-independent protein translocase protein TatA
MFGISAAELFVILLVAILVIPAKNWPDVAKFLASLVKFMRNLIWKISDAGEQIKEQIELERPITEMIQSATGNVMEGLSMPRDKTRKKKK